MRFHVGQFARVLLCVCFAITTALAQYRAGIQGTVADASGAVVKDAKVTVTSQDTGKVVETQSNENGFYTVSGLAPGHYTVNVSAANFKASVTKDLEVNGDLVKGLNVTLKPGGASEQVEVTGASVSAIQTEDANLNGTISAKAV